MYYQPGDSATAKRIVENRTERFMTAFEANITTRAVLACRVVLRAVDVPAARLQGT